MGFLIQAQTDSVSTRYLRVVVISVETADGLFSNTEIPEWNTKLFADFPALPSTGTLYKILVSNILPEQIENS